MTPVPVPASSPISSASSSLSSASDIPSTATRSTSSRLLKQAHHRSASCDSADARPNRSDMGGSNRRADNFAFVRLKCLTSVLMVLMLLLACDAQSSSSSSFSSSSAADPVTRSENFQHEVMDESRSPITAVFSTTNVSINFTHITFDAASDKLYVGATNWLYQLDANLSVDQQVRTGPVEDSPNCSPTDCSGVDSSLIRLSKNTNKVLVIDPSSRMLISCGSVHQGACRRHSLSDIRIMEPLVGVPVAANDENSSTIAFVSPASYGNSVSSVLYVGASNSRQGPYRDVVPAISSRSLEAGSGLFSIIEKSFTETARVDISYHLRDYFLVKYITGFHSGDFVYFATVQKKSHFRALEEWGYVSRLARVCSSDPGFHTYTEMTISCIGPDGTDYALLQDVTVSRLSPALARSLGMDEDDEAFVGVFGESKDHSMNPSGGSAMCVFPMTEIERGFMENIHLCYNGSVRTRNMDFIAGNIQDCPEPGKSGNIVSFCSETLKLNGTIPVVRSPVITYPNTNLVSVVLVTSGKHTIAFAGTSSGHVKKMSLGRSSAEEIDDYIIDEGHAILPDMFTDRSQHSIYAASAYKIVKLQANFHKSKSNASRPQVRKSAKVAQASETFSNKPIQLPDIVVRPETGTKQPIPMLDVVQQPSSSKQADGKRTMPGAGRGGLQRTPVTDLNGARVVVPAGKNTDASDEIGSSKDVSPLLLYFLPAAAAGALVALVLITVIGVRRKVSSHSSFSRDGNHLIWTPSDQDSKLPPPLVPTSTKPLPLIPLPNRHTMFEKSSGRDLSPSESQVYAIYSEISDFGQERISSDAGSLVSGINRHLLKQQAPSPRLNAYHQQKQQGKECNLETESSILIGSSSNHVTRIPAYPPFLTFNAVGRNRDRVNPYIFQMSHHVCLI